jgi:hypothetical protein
MDSLNIFQQHKYTCITIYNNTALVVLQSLEDCEEAQDVLSEISPDSSHDNSDNSIEVEELSAAEKDVGPVPDLFPRIEAESEVSSVSTTIRITCFAKFN